MPVHIDTSFIPSRMTIRSALRLLNKIAQSHANGYDLPLTLSHLGASFDIEAIEHTNVGAVIYSMVDLEPTEPEQRDDTVNENFLTKDGRFIPPH